MIGAHRKETVGSRTHPRPSEEGNTFLRRSTGNASMARIYFRAIEALQTNSRCCLYYIYCYFHYLLSQFQSSPSAPRFWP